MSINLRNRISSKIVNILKCPPSKILSSLELNKNKNHLEFHLPTNNFKENLSSSNVEQLEKIEDASIVHVKLDSCSKRPKFIFHLNKKQVIQEVLKEPLNIAPAVGSQNILVEFSSPNIAKPFHVGHLRSTIIGNFLSNLFHESGNSVTKLNYLGDWGTQFGFLKVGIDLENLTDEEIRKNPIQCLFKAYVTANTLAQRDPSIHEKAKQVFQQLESDSFQDMQKWETYRQYTIDELRRIYQRLNVEFDEYNWESMYNKKKIQEIVDMMDARNILTVQEDGKRVVEVGDRKIPIMKSDGTTLYLTRDLAAIIDRKKRFNFDRIYYVVDNGQNDHFQALKSLVQQLKFNWANQMEHVKFGRIKGMSTRKGTVVFLQDILDEAKEIMWRRQNETSNATNPPYPPYPGQNPPYPGYPPQDPYQQAGGPNIGFVNPGAGGYPGAGYPQPGYPGGYAPQNDFQPSPNPPYADPEDGGYKGFGFDDKSIRMGFIRKVYSILSVQLLVTLGFICMFTMNEGARRWTESNPGVVIACMVASIVLMLVIVCCENARRTAPMNLILLGLFTLCEGVTIGVITTAYKVNEVMMAVGLTAAIVIGLTLFAFQTKIDFTMMGGVLCIAVLLLFAMSIVGIFFRNNFFQFLIACAGAVIFSIYIIYDTQLMMGGEHKYSISPEEYVFASLNLYLDIINLFLYLLRILRYLNSE